VLGAIEFLGDELSILGQNGIRLGHACHAREGLAPESFYQFQGGSLRIGQAQSSRKVCAQNPILGRQILILEEQFSVDQTGDVSEQPNPFVLSCGAAIIPRLLNCAEYIVLTGRPFRIDIV
jgi:hypothetical protein